MGGGPTGVEFAGEVLTDMPGKKVFIVQAGPSLLAGAADLPKKARDDSRVMDLPAPAAFANHTVSNDTCLASAGSAPQYMDSVAAAMTKAGATVILGDRVDLQGCVCVQAGAFCRPLLETEPLRVPAAGAARTAQRQGQLLPLLREW